jgi:hypothetical protein
MAEITGLAIGVASLLAGFKGAVDGYSLLESWKHAFEDSSYFAAKLEIERRRLQIWGDLFGFSDQNQCERLRDESENTQNLVLYILMEIKLATTDVEKLMGKYGLRLVEMDSKKTSTTTHQLRFKSNVLDSLVERQKEYTSKLPRFKRGLQWTLDLPKFEKLLDRLEYLNDSLEKVVPRVESQMLALGLPSYVLPKQNLKYLPAFKDSSQVILSSCAVAKDVKLSGNVFNPVPEVSIDHCNRGTPKTLMDGTEREVCQYLDESEDMKNVVIEWKSPPPSNMTMDFREEVWKRVKNLGRFFATPKSSYFRTLPFQGLVEDLEFAKQNPGQKKHGFMFDFPTDNVDAPETLTDCLKNLVHVPIGTRFRLAQALASSLLLLHSSKWVHKSLRSDSVLLFPEISQGHGSFEYLTCPYLTGFSFARPDRPNELSMEKPIPAELDLYRHPDHVAGYTRFCDIYSLGVILFEIGIWKSIESIHERNADQLKSESDMQKYLCHNSGKALQGMMGTTYATVVRRCLTGDFGVETNQAEEDELSKAFWTKIVRELDTCRA